MRLMVLSPMFAFAVASPSRSDDIMAGYCGNTAIATGGLAETHTTYDKDHGFVVRVPAPGAAYNGTWQVKASSLCRGFQSPPPGAANSLCTPIEPHKVADTSTISFGNQVRAVTLVQGIQ